MGWNSDFETPQLDISQRLSINRDNGAGLLAASYEYAERACGGELEPKETLTIGAKIADNSFSTSEKQQPCETANEVSSLEITFSLEITITSLGSTGRA